VSKHLPTGENAKAFINVYGDYLVIERFLSAGSQRINGKFEPGFVIIEDFQFCPNAIVTLLIESEDQAE
jgi:hypothetical protein